ncbi:MAG: sulfotransferase domain-containing protein [Rubrobacter sp.]|nr:sulfotransferase domain-containing protein [Rubrobacter sp.]
MPIFRFSKAFSVGRDVKVFLNLRGGLTRQAVPDAEEQHEGRVQKLSNVVKEQRETLKSKNWEIQRQAENLKNARRRVKEEKKARKNNDREVFRLRNELRAAEERAGGSPQIAGTLETGALPDFVIIGVVKGGTTSLYDLLIRHPNIEPAALKEIRYFNRNFEKGIEWYRSNFPLPRWKDGHRSITGEATPRYLSHPSAPERMAKAIPWARLIALLRNPVDRAYSNYQHALRSALETRTFEEAVEAEEAWLRGEEGEAEREEPGAAGRPRFGYLREGIYVDHLKRWSGFFGEEQMLVLKSEDFFECESEVLKVVLDFIGLPEWEPETWEIPNKGRYERGMEPETRRRLEEFFEPHNRRLYEYLGVDFGW